MCRHSIHSTGGRLDGRRGVAMLLVLISVMAATIVTTAYVSSRDNSTTIGENGANITAARWAAESGLDLAVATLQTQVNWRQACISTGCLFRNYTLNGAAIDVYITEIGGASVTATSENVRVLAVARRNGVEQSVAANVHVPLDPAMVDVDLSEFAIFASTAVTMSNRSLLARWPMAPYSELGRPLLIGTRATSAGSITLSHSAAAIDTRVVHGPGASNSLITNSDSPELTKLALLDHMPFPNPPSHNEILPGALLSDLSMSGGNLTVTSSQRYNNIELKNNAARTLRGGISLIADGDLNINSGAKLIIEGQVKVIVFGNLNIDQGAIELKTASARLQLYVRGGTGNTAVSIRDGFLGEFRTTSARDNTGKAVWIDPQRLTLFSIAPASGSYEWRLEQNSVMKGSIYAPHASRVTLANTSALYGRVASTTVELRDDAALFYDPALDLRCGFAYTTSPIYDEDQRMLNEFKTLTSLDANTLQIAANTSRTIIKTDTGVKQIATSTLLTPVVPDDLQPNDPTPRPLKIQFRLVAFGNDVKSWE